MRKLYIVWNNHKSEGYVTDDYQMAYEARKSATSNMFNAQGEWQPLGAAFGSIFYQDDCAIQEIEVEEIEE